jgi:site-specific recombinase XerD
VRAGKESKDRYCLADPHTLSLLKLDGPPQESLFGLHTSKSMETLVARLASETGLDRVYAARGEHLTPHSFRHAFATHLYLNGLELVSLRRLLGHEDLATTLVYTQVPLSHVQDAYAHCHPLQAPK